MLIFLREINTLAAPSHSHTAKLAFTEDIRLSSSEFPLMFPAYRCSVNVVSQNAILEIDVLFKEYCIVFLQKNTDWIEEYVVT